MSNTELKSVGEMCDEIKALKAENKSLKEEITELKEEEPSEDFERGYETCKNDMFDDTEAAVKPLEAEIKRRHCERICLKAEIKSLANFRSEVIDAMKYDEDCDDEDLINDIEELEEKLIGECELEERIRDLKEENKSLKSGVNEAYDICPVDSQRIIDDQENKIKYYQFYLHTMDESGKFDLSKDDVDKFTDDEKLREYLYGEIGYEEDKYGDADDWTQCYGFTTKDGEYRMNIAGGGSHWEDYVMTKNGCFIHNKDGKKKVFTFVSCPESTYVKVWTTPEMEGGLSLGEGETDMYEMVKDCFPEIMDYEEEEEEFIVNQVVVNDEGELAVKQVGNLKEEVKKKKKKEKKEKTKK